MPSPLFSRTKLLGAGISVGVIIVALALVVILFITRPRPEQRTTGVGAPRVVVIELDQIPVRPIFSGFGVAAAFTRADVPSRVSSTVIEVPSTSLAGARVEVGTVLVVLDETDAQRRLDSSTQQIAGIDAQLSALETEERSFSRQATLAEEDVALARQDMERVRAAYADGAAKDREVDRARQIAIVAERLAVTLREQALAVPARRDALKAQRSGFEAQQRQAATDVTRCRIESPVAGVIQQFDLKVGEMVRAGDMVARVVDASHIEVPLQLPAGVRPLVRVGDQVELKSTDRRARDWSATVARIAPEDDQRNRTFTVWAELTQDLASAAAIAPGMFLEALVRSALPQTLTVIPRRAIRGDLIFVVEDGRIRHVEIDEAFPVAGPYEGAPVPDREWVAIRTELPLGTRVVLDAARVLPNGGLIQPVAPGATANSIEGATTATPEPGR